MKKVTVDLVDKIEKATVSVYVLSFDNVPNTNNDELFEKLLNLPEEDYTYLMGLLTPSVQNTILKK